MINAREFTEQIAQQCEPLYQLTENNVKLYWANNPSKEEAIDYFGRRMINERINCIELSRRVSQLSDDVGPEEMFLLSKQAHDEAKHFWFVKDILTDLMGQEPDVEAVYQAIKEKQLRGEAVALPAELLAKFECTEDPIALAVYQYIAEGMAYRNWVAQAECAPTTMIAEKYAEIAKDEKFHSQIGRMQIEKLVVDQATLAHATELAQEVIDLIWSFGRSDKERCIKAHIPLSALN
jgi:rubrerythrin